MSHNQQNKGASSFAELPCTSKAAVASPEAGAQSLLDSSVCNVAVITIVQYDFVGSTSQTQVKHLDLYILRLHDTLLNPRPIH